jgi:hypothetical protein
MDKDGKQISLLPAEENLPAEEDKGEYFSSLSGQGGSLGTLGDLLQRKLHSPEKGKKGKKKGVS